MGRMREKLRSISMLVAAADTPVPLIFDSLRLQRSTYTARLRSGLSFLLQVQNLTNSSYRTYAGTKDRPLENIEWGRTVLFGGTYKF